MKGERLAFSVRSGSIVAAAILLAEVASGLDRHEARQTAREDLRRRQDEWLQLAGRRPPPTREVANTLAADEEEARRTVAQTEAALAGGASHVRTAMAGNDPGSRTDAYFELAAFGERMRELARSLGVTVAPDAAHFGFSAYANEAPAAGHLAAVFRQRVVGEQLVRVLLESGPRALLAIKRERPRDEVEQAARITAAGGRGGEEAGRSRAQSVNGPDYFEPEPRLSVRAPGAVETMAFRFTFTGRTAALRAFLSRIGSGELSILVRSVEVEPVTGGEAGNVVREAAVRRPPASGGSSFVLRENNGLGLEVIPAPADGVAPSTQVVPRPWSRFTVTVEHIELIATGATRGRAGAGRPDGA